MLAENNFFISFPGIKINNNCEKLFNIETKYTR